MQIVNTVFIAQLAYVALLSLEFVVLWLKWQLATSWAHGEDHRPVDFGPGYGHYTINRIHISNFNNNMFGKFVINIINYYCVRTTQCFC